MAKRKFSQKYCKVCRVVVKMEVVGEEVENNSLWIKCSKCHQVFPFLSEDFYHADDEVDVEVRSDEESTPYDPKKTFTIGQAVFHEGWNDTGKVIKKEVISNGNNVIVVSFLKSGIKKLVENY